MTSSHPELERLLHRVARGDVSALARLYDLTAPTLFRILRAGLPDAQAAEEALTATYVELWREGARYPSDRSATAWVLGHLHRELDRRGTSSEALHLSE